MTKFIEERVHDLEKEVAELKLIVHELRKPSAVIEVSTPVVEKKPKTANELRGEIIEKAKLYLKENKNSQGHYEVPGFGCFPFSCNAEFVVNEEKRTVVVLLRGYESNNIYARGIAKCNPSDVFNSHIGKAISLGRALNIDVSEFEQAVQPTEKVVGMLVKVTYDDAKNETMRITKSFGRDSEGIWCCQARSAYANSGVIINDTNAIYEV